MNLVFFHRRLRISPLFSLGLVVGLLLFVSPSLASCTFTVSPVSFGNYNVFSSTETDSTGSINLVCTLAILVQISLSTGQSGTFSPRMMKNGTNSLQYNLYQDLAHTIIWGDGTGGSQSFSQLLTILNPSFPIYGRIPPQQNVHVGTYTDTVVVTTNF